MKKNVGIHFISMNYSYIAFWLDELCTTCCYIYMYDELSECTCIVWKEILWKYFYSLAPIFVVSIKCIDPWVLKLVVSNITGNSQWDNCISLDFNFRSFKWTTKSTKIRTPRLIMYSQYIVLYARRCVLCR